MRKSVILLPIVGLLFVGCGDSDKLYEDRIKHLESEISYLQGRNDNMLERMTELDVINREDATTIRESMESLNQQYAYIENLTEKIHQKDSINFALVQNLKSSLIDIEDEDVQIEVKGSAVYVSLSDKLLFRSASSKVNKAAYRVLEKVARIIEDNDALEVLVQGHTDNVPISNKSYKDNWDLSVKRATSVVRILQDNFGVYPGKLTAAGRGEYAPKDENDTSSGRQINRRTDIILKPRLGQFFELLQAPDILS